VTFLLIFYKKLLQLSQYSVYRTCVQKTDLNEITVQNQAIIGTCGQ